MRISGHAHLCFLSPIDEQGNYAEFKGHVIGEQHSVYGIAGQKLSNYNEPDWNDCLEPVVYYQCVVKDYDSNKECRVVVRRPIGNDAAGILSATNNEDDISLTFSTDRLLAGVKARQHCVNYLGLDNGSQDDVIVCMGSIQLNLPCKFFFDYGTRH
ncbi:hypothetical protein LRAMOSA09983 [Lichtheimia ramosa]|uniref:Uncharacterized protein n=1 Tax=Lichtheimia ramosa TaxID=688394 RepID=A0A077WPG3_9FUNG|nr:hypothetical protein LRAMOSA09983 [Lichtheimia ramosa]